MYKNQRYPYLIEDLKNIVLFRLMRHLCGLELIRKVAEKGKSADD